MAFFTAMRSLGQLEGFHLWPTLKHEMNKRAGYLGFKGWGMFGDTHNDLLISEYNSGNINLFDDDHGLGFKVIDQLIDKNYKFLPLHQIPEKHLF
ncbi:hypothetical protein [Marinicella sp. W31]|uniref:hypothetical protein n=1 Tax=Marinicella sp. W31 TaxID=3023713 RepID=UPI00375701CE